MAAQASVIHPLHIFQTPCEQAITADHLGQAMRACISARCSRLQRQQAQRAHGVHLVVTTRQALYMRDGDQHHNHPNGANGDAIQPCTLGVALHLRGRLGPTCSRGFHSVSVHLPMPPLSR